MQWIKTKSQLQEYYPFSRMPGIPESFAEYLKKNPNKKHISTEEKWKLIGWLSDSSAKPSCQKDYSRKNYVHRTYRWDANRQQLLEMARNGKEDDRIVITVDEILRVVEEVHITDHAGWDATWSRVSKKYCGIVRSDVIWLITKCGLCKVDPRKKSRGTQENQAPASAPVVSPPITPPEAGFGYNNNDDTVIQVQNHQGVFQDVFQDVYFDTYQNTYLDIYQDGYQDIFQDGYLDLYSQSYQESYQDVPQGGFQDAFHGGYQDGGWQGEFMNIDPSLLMLDESLHANYSQGEASGTNNYTFNDESGQ